MTNLPLIFEFDEELTEIIDNEKDESKLFFEKYQGYIMDCLTISIDISILSYD